MSISDQIRLLRSLSRPKNAAAAGEVSPNRRMTLAPSATHGARSSRGFSMNSSMIRFTCRDSRREQMRTKSFIRPRIAGMSALRSG